MAMTVTVKVVLKNGVLDPQGKAIAHALNTLGFDEVVDARQGKTIELVIDGASDEAAVKEQVAKMCDKLLANPVIEDYSIESIAQAA